MAEVVRFADYKPRPGKGLVMSFDKFHEIMRRDAEAKADQGDVRLEAEPEDSGIPSDVHP
jgi:hypothetical protein